MMIIFIVDSQYYRSGQHIVCDLSFLPRAGEENLYSFQSLAFTITMDWIKNLLTNSSSKNQADLHQSPADAAEGEKSVKSPQVEPEASLSTKMTKTYNHGYILNRPPFGFDIAQSVTPPLFLEESISFHPALCISRTITDSGINNDICNIIYIYISVCVLTTTESPSGLMMMPCSTPEPPRSGK